LLRETGVNIDFNLKKATRIATEVYPHPAMILLFELNRIIKYKKKPKNGSREVQKEEFKRLQSLLRKCLGAHFPELECSPQIQTLLDTSWKKEIEDQTDAFFCALLGYFHWRSNGHLCRVVGMLEEGFILLPPRFRNGFALMESRPSNRVVTMELVNKLRDED
jgi:predicted RNase H-like nuclease